MMRLFLVNYGLQTAANTQQNNFSKHILRFDCTPHYLAFLELQLAKICHFFPPEQRVSPQN